MLFLVLQVHKNSLTCIKKLSKYKKLIGTLRLLVNETKDNVVLELSMEDSKYELPEFLVATERYFYLTFFELLQRGILYLKKL